MRRPPSISSPTRYGADHIGAGDEIVLSILEHHSNIVPWHFRRERDGAVLKWVPISDTGEFLFEEFERLLTPRTKLVAITHMSNVSGTLVPVKEVIRSRTSAASPCSSTAARRRCTCASTCAISTAIFMCSPATRPTGPRASACSTPRRRMLDAMRPYQGGGNMIESVHVDAITYGKTPQKFEAGTPTIVEAIGLGAGLNYMMQVGRDKIARHEAELRTYAHARLSELPWSRSTARRRARAR